MSKVIIPAKSGIDALVMLDNIELGGQKSAQLTQTMSVINVTNNITSDWTRNISGVKSWVLTCNGFVLNNKESLIALQEAFSNGTELTIKFSDGDINFEGKALITSLPFNASYHDSCTYAIQFTGTGEISIPSGQK